MHKYDACAVSESKHIVFLFCIASIVERAVSPEKIIFGRHFHCMITCHSVRGVFTQPTAMTIPTASESIVETDQQ